MSARSDSVENSFGNALGSFGGAERTRTAHTLPATSTAPAVQEIQIHADGIDLAFDDVLMLIVLSGFSERRRVDDPTDV
jgi:hypothetical protein